MLGCQSVYGAAPGYRVELLVLRHLDGQAELPPQTTLRDFSAGLDLLLPPAESAAAEPVVAGGTPVQDIDAQALVTDAAPETAEPEVADAAAQIVLVETQSDMMQLAWQRLRGSSAYRPELYLSWQQPGQQPFPLIRVHDQEVLIEDDPYAGLRMNVDEDAESANSAFPEPTRFYRLDGTARLRQSRFLHLDLDLEYREPLSADVAPAEPPAAADQAYGQTARRPTAYRVHTLQLSRQVQIQRMEYFDGPVFGVLALVSRIDVTTAQDTLADDEPD